MQPTTHTPAAQLRQSSPLVVRSRLGARDSRDQMADDFRVLVVTAGGITNEDLLVLGWTQEQINLHAAQARSLALKSSLR